ncbi:MAG: hypothetical protein KAI18_03840 [Candidatus Aenigmarchaeota archaeon]|nr:hypothetical protein [Candidatus Aenigmarchaeota archaeon]
MPTDYLCICLEVLLKLQKSERLKIRAVGYVDNSSLIDLNQKTSRHHKPISGRLIFAHKINHP